MDISFRAMFSIHTAFDRDPFQLELLESNCEQHARKASEVYQEYGLGIGCLSDSLPDVESDKGAYRYNAERGREEWGWWSVNFRQVMRELQRRNVILVEVGAC